MGIMKEKTEEFMQIKVLQKIIDKLRGKPVRFYMLDKKVSVHPTADIDSNTEIGDYTYINKNVDITKAKIGRYCSIGSHVRIGLGEHDITQISTSSLLCKDGGYKALTKKDCIIKNDVWIGVGAVIRRGVTVGNGAVIGANSFVNKDVPDFAVVGGCPAKIIKYRFDKDKINKILQSEYWNYTPAEAGKIIANLEQT